MSEIVETGELCKAQVLVVDGGLDVFVNGLMGEEDGGEREGVNLIEALYLLVISRPLLRGSQPRGELRGYILRSYQNSMPRGSRPRHASGQ